MRDRGRVVKLVVGMVVICLAGTAVLLLLFRTFWGTVLNEPTTVEVQVEAPDQVSIHEPFAVTIQMTNLITESQNLHSIDLDTRYLQNVRLDGSSPTYQASRKLPLTRFTSYRFDQTLPAGRTTTVELLFVGEAVGQFYGLMDICLMDGTLCLALPLETEVVE